MNPLIQPKQTTFVLLITFGLACFALAPLAQAVSPPPDGGYPGGNTAEGQNALFGLTTGGYNTAIGFFSLRSDVTGGFNTALGAGALFANTGDQNTATGAAALLSNTTGSYNTAAGFLALSSNNADSNSAFGWGALHSNTSGTSNAALGVNALGANNGDFNTATGFHALYNLTAGNGNTVNGYNALSSATLANYNTAIGFEALANLTSGDLNIVLGWQAGGAMTNANGTIAIGADGGNVDNACFIANIDGVTTQHNDAIPVLIDSSGQLGTASSSRRYKTDIKPIDKTSEAILALKPVSFHYKVHKDSTPHFGLIAEEVAQVNPDLVIYDPDGKPYTVRYEAVNAMLLNEFLKEHRTVQEQDARLTKQEALIACQQKQIEALAAGLEKVSAQLEVTKPVPQTVLNNQ